MGKETSTTGNIYGIYDTVGGIGEYVMGATVNQDTVGLNLASSGFTIDLGKENTLPDSKYYDMYTDGESELAHQRGHYGDATKETLANFSSNQGGWNNDALRFPIVSSNVEPWFLRGGNWYDGASAGIYSFVDTAGVAMYNRTFRSVLSHA